jgi:mannan endo-1,4-beta-mannosidase
MKYKISLIIAVITLLVVIFYVFVLVYGSSSKIIDSTPCNVNATDDTKSVLKYLAKLSGADIKKAIIGQNCYHGNEITDEHPQKGYTSMIADLHEKTGKWVGIVGIDYEYMKVYSPNELSKANKVLIAHWKKGGLVTINFSPQNPWFNDEAVMIKNSKTWDGPGSPTDLSQANLKDLIDPSKSVSKGWRKKLDRLAGALKELQDAGVVVMWRPMQEMNGDWFWWGNDSSAYIKVYKDMYSYFTKEKKLNNLLWVYSPFGNIPDNRAYPGDQYVDIVAPTCYDDNLRLMTMSYNLFTAAGKPFGFAEYGPMLGQPVAKNGTLDTTLFIKGIKEDYPGAAFWICWHSYPEVCWSIISNKNYNALMNDPDVITLDKLDWKGK